MKTERRISLSVKISVLIIILTFGSAAMSILAGYREHKQTTDKFYEDLSRNIAHTVSNSLNGAKVRLLLDAAQTPEYREILKKARQDQDPAPIVEYLKSRHLLLTYDNINEILRQYTQYMDVEYIYLQYIGNGTFCRLVDPDDGYLSYGLTDKLDGPYVQYSGQNESIPATISETSLGTLVTSFEPVYDNEGSPVALVGVDVSVEKMRAEHQRFAMLCIVNALIMASMAAAAGVFFIRHTVTNPLERLAVQTRAFTNKRGHYDSGDIIAVDVHSRDEIEDLYNEIRSMEKKIVEYLDHLIKVTGEKERARTELNIAAQIQNDMLPQTFPPFPCRREFDLYASMDPAREVGGDFYDFFMIDDDHLALVMADVSGKGVPAALFMVISKTLIKNITLSGSRSGPGDILSDVNDRLCEGNEDSMFVTVWLGILTISTGQLVSACAGHEYPVFYRRESGFGMEKDPHGPALGTMEGLRYREAYWQMNPGDLLFLYTDGVPEATDASMELFGNERMLEALAESWSLENLQSRHSNTDQNDVQTASGKWNFEDLQTFLTMFRRHVDDFVGEAPQFDDLTMMCFSYNGSSETPESR